jgi:hypothetical protein
MDKERMSNPRAFAAQLLEQVLDGHLTTNEAIEKWPASEQDHLMETVYCLLYHYRDDQAIRAKDSRYARWQDEEFRKLLEELRPTPPNK